MESDDLIKALINTKRLADEAELAQIVQHVSQKPMSTRLIKINQWLRYELAMRSVQVPSDRIPSVELHLLKRIHFDGQWPLDTTPAQYETDLHRAVLHPQVRVWTYFRLKEHCVGFLAPSHIHSVPNPETFIFVAYSADFGTIKTGYQASSSEAVFNDTFEQLMQHR
jgi:hypothetical protein